MRAPLVEDRSPEQVKPKTPVQKYTAMFRRRKTKKQEEASPLMLAKQTAETHYLADNASILPRPSDVGTTVSTSKYRVRRDIQSHIPDWIDDVVHAQLLEIAERLATEPTDADAEGLWSPTMAEPEHPDEVTVQEDLRPGSAPEASREEPLQDTPVMSAPRRSSVSAPSFMSFSQFPHVRALVSPIESWETSTVQTAEPTAEPATEEQQPVRHSRNLSSSSGASSASHGTGTSDYSKRSSNTSPGTTDEKHMSDQLSNRMTWKDIATTGYPIKKPVEAGVLRKVNVHLAKPSTSYTIMSPVHAGVFDEVKLHVNKPSTSYSILSPVQAGVFDEEARADLNKPLPPDPNQQSKDKRTTFFVVGDIVLSPHIPQTPHSPRSPRSPRILNGPKVPNSPRSASSPRLPHSALLPRPQTMDTTEGLTAKKFARLSRPFSEPVFDFAFEEGLPTLGEEEEDEDNGVEEHVELVEKFVVVDEQPREGVSDGHADITREAALSSPGIASPPPYDAGSSDLHTSDVKNSEAEERDVLQSEIQVVYHVEYAVKARVVDQVQEEAANASADKEAEQAQEAVRAQVEGQLPSQTTDESEGGIASEVEQHVEDDAAEEVQIVLQDHLHEEVPGPEQSSGESGFAQETNHEETQRVERDEEHEENQDNLYKEQHDDEDGDEVESDDMENEESDGGDMDGEGTEGCPSPTLSQAENDLMAQLALDCSYKFMRPASWLCDSPTLGRKDIPELTLDEATPKAEPTEEETFKVAAKKKTQSHYEFLWSPEQGWYVS